MMTRSKRAALALAASAFAALPGVAQAQAACVSEEEVSSLVIYGMPHALRAVRNKCAASLAPDGFMATQSRDMASRYMALSDESWPGALSMIQNFADEATQGAQGFQLDQLPPELVRPLMDEMLGQKIIEELALDDCRQIERAAEAISPLEPQETGSIAGILLALANVENPPICPVE